jgi:2-oxoisovalerate ferredoxin oxidoreductase beta subunit
VTALYQRFERHAHGEGSKAQSTHYCAGCGHGLAHKLLARAIDELGIRDRTVAVSPVGCGVFLYYSLDVGNTLAAHGRAPAVALGHKLASPDSVVVAYQGDGDLASIGLAEIVHAAQLGVPITVVFVNNAIYGMTGGQLAPTTLLGQRTTTSPGGRDATMGQPLRMAELVAQLDGPVYVERVALFDAKQRVRAGRAIRKALQLQVDGVGFALVEVLAECPTHLRLSPVEAERWVRERMLPVFPLGVKKDAAPAPRAAPPAPDRDPGALLAALGVGADAAAPRRGGGFPRTGLGGEVGLKLAGAGGDGAQTAAALLTRAAIHEGFDATHIPSYGPESRGGTSYADVRIAEDEVFSPDVPAPDALVALNAPSLARFAPTVVPGGVVVYDSSVARPPPGTGGARLVGVPCSEIARDLGAPVVKNHVALGALHGALGLFPEETFLVAIRQALRGKGALAAANEEAFSRGARAGARAPAARAAGAGPGPDGPAAR